MTPLDPRDHSWLTESDDPIASSLTEFDALCLAQKCADKFHRTYVVTGPLFRTMVEPKTSLLRRAD